MFTRSLARVASSIVLISCFSLPCVAEIPRPADVKGRIFRTKVHLKTADFECGVLSLYERDSWRSSPSICVDLQNYKKKMRPGKSIRIRDTNYPSINCRWKRKRKSNRNYMDHEEVFTGYDLEIKFRSGRRGMVEAIFKLSIPDKQTELRGKFQFALKDFEMPDFVKKKR